MSYSAVGAWYNPLDWVASQRVRPESIVGKALAPSAPAVTVVQAMAVATQAQVNAFKNCANFAAARAGYLPVPDGALGPKTCGLASSDFGAGCPDRDLILRTCVQMGQQFEPPVKASSPAAATVTYPEEPSFWSNRSVLYLGLAVVGAAVFFKMRQDKKKALRSNAKRRSARPQWSASTWRGEHPTLREQAAERAALIAELGMEPEDGTADGRYAATTGELRKWALEKRTGR